MLFQAVVKFLPSSKFLEISSKRSIEGYLLNLTNNFARNFMLTASDWSTKFYFMLSASDWSTKFLTCGIYAERNLRN